MRRIALGVLSTTLITIGVWIYFHTSRVTVQAQPLRDRIIVASVVLRQGGFIVIEPDDVGFSEVAVATSTYMPAGSYQDIEIVYDQEVLTVQASRTFYPLRALLYKDVNKNRIHDGGDRLVTGIFGYPTKASFRLENFEQTE